MTDETPLFFKIFLVVFTLIALVGVLPSSVTLALLGLVVNLPPPPTSEPIPTTQQQLLHIVRDNFQAEVLDACARRATLVDFYAPWCGYCKQVAPIVAELANAYAAVDSIAVGTFDATKNNVNDLGIALDHYPTLFLFPQGCTSVAQRVEFTYGMPTVKKLIGWMADYANLSDPSAIRRFTRTPSLVDTKAPTVDANAAPAGEGGRAGGKEEL
uniref:protein disulfide-isomerase n=1 Tax=Sexangularia sp. CB-2014 TaxID=1486929 RepID=A0A7S1VP32_9EUKA